MTKNEMQPKSEQPFQSQSPTTDENFVTRFLDHVLKTGDPVSFPGLSTTRPPEGADFFWRTGVIIVPVHRSEHGAMVVCPWCSPTTPKFKRGRLCFFPAEAIHRFVGRQCAKSHLDSDSIREADKRWAREQEKIRCINFLRENCIRVEALLRSAEALKGIATACDRFYAKFSRDSSEVHADLARYVRDGRLHVDQALGAGARRQGQSSISVLIGVLDGVRVFKSKPTLEKRLAVARAQLESISSAAHRARFGELSHLDDRERYVLQVMIQEAHKALSRIVRVIEEFQLFMRPKNIALLNEWCGHKNSDVHSSDIALVLNGSRLRISYSVNGNRCTTSVLADDAMFERPPFIDALRSGSNQ